MSNGVPRRLIEELVTRWQLTKLKTLAVEGPSDKRFFQLLKQEDYCPRALSDPDVLSIDSIEVPPQMLQDHMITSDGAKQRVIAFTREITRRGSQPGFRGVVDTDLDRWTGCDYSSEVLLYTDGSSLESYLWNQSSLRRLLIAYKCDDVLNNEDGLSRLYLSINVACSTASAIRLALHQPNHSATKFVQSDRALLIDSGEVIVIKDFYTNQQPHQFRTQFSRQIDSYVHEILQSESHPLINGHDLPWIMRFFFSQASPLPKRQIEENVIMNALISHGLTNPEIAQSPLIRDLALWCS
jgi:hypothetical protein